MEHVRIHHGHNDGCSSTTYEVLSYRGSWDGWHMYLTCTECRHETPIGLIRRKCRNPACGTPLWTMSKADYCNDACKQEAYRLRKSAEVG